VNEEIGRNPDRKGARCIVEFRLGTAVRAWNVAFEVTRTCDNSAVCYSDLSRSDIPL
jgi:hypothetical protein